MASRSPRVAVVDYGSGNLRSVAKALVRSGISAEVTGEPAALERADGVVLPGVGAFADSASSLRACGLDDALGRVFESGRPYLGLCLGLQLLFEESDEHATTAGLGLLPGRVERFPERGADGGRLRVPHIGWNTVRWSGDHPMLASLPEQDVYYFVHSFRAVPKEEAHVVGVADYGKPFAAAVARGNLFAVQFHPEKSQTSGKRILDAFATWLAA